MKNQLIQFDKSKGQEPAKDYFLEMCGFTRKAVSPKKIDRALQTMNDIYDKLQIKVVISEYEGSCVDGAEMNLDGEVFHCKALSQIPAGEIEKVYIYLMTTGDTEAPGANALNEVYYDMWRTAYVYAGNDMLKQCIQERSNNADSCVSYSFGPGFFGMEASELTKFFPFWMAKRFKCS